MAKRTIKTLDKTGRISRKKASETATSLRQALVKSGEAVKKATISKNTTASGRAKIAFHVSGTVKDSKKPSAADRRRTA